jgi:5-methyltetrahydrofolate--homocysteine methyltransferase
VSEPLSLRPDVTQTLITALKLHILVLDGAMGTMTQQHTFSKQEYRGERFVDWHDDLKGNNDLLTLTQSATISAIHRA